MAILSTIKKVLPYIKTATGYVLCRLSSQAVEMDDGTTLQESYDSLNSKIKYETIEAEKTFPTGRSYFDLGPITIPTGYKCIGLSLTHIRADWIQCSLALKDNNMVNLVAYNYFTSSITSDIEISAIYAKD